MTISRARLLFLTLTTAFSCPLAAQYPGVQSTVERQIQTLEQKKIYAASLIAQADEAIKKDPVPAYQLYKSALDILPRGGSAVDSTRQTALDGFCAAAVKLANLHLSQGRYDDALAVVDVVLEDRYNPNYEPALSLRKHIIDPQFFADKGTLTPDQVYRIGEVQKLLKEGLELFASGRFDLSFKRCEQILYIDKNNIAARRLMEKIKSERTKYSSTAFNDSRGDLLAKVSKAWESPVKKFSPEATSIVDQPQLSARSTQAVSDKLDSIKIPRLDFTDATIREALDFIKKRSRELDDSETDPDKKGINIVLKLSPDDVAYNSPITLSLDDVPLRDALQYVSQAASLKIKIDPFAVVVVPEEENTDVLITKEYKAPPGFIQSVPGASSGAVLEGVAAGSQSVIVARSPAKEYLEANGVAFPPGASANYMPSSSRLIVKNTQTNLELVDALVETATEAPETQIEIQAKFLEISQTNLNELGFDWLLGSFSLPGGSGFTGGGGTQGSGATINKASFPINSGILGSQNLPAGSTSTTSGPLTAGNRNGSSAISVNAIDALLLGAPFGPAAGALSVAGIFTDPEFQVVLRAINQKKGVDMISSPTVTTKSGTQAKVEIVREFRYPTEFAAPEPQGSAGGQFTPSVPAAPSGWTIKPTGITLEVLPTLESDNYTIQLELEPRVIEFDGFINYGSPINSTVQAQGIYSAIAPTSKTFEATANAINQPVFSVREIKTQVSVYDGQTVVMGGLMREDVQKVEDKVPLLGDIPLAGRLFRSSADKHTKRNLIMFVTASIMDPSGQPFASNNEEEIFPPSIEEIVPQPASVQSTQVHQPVLNSAEDLTPPLPQ
jgi:general secretion pathway protein D